jgi:hypothetical protein
MTSALLLPLFLLPTGAPNAADRVEPACCELSAQDVSVRDGEKLASEPGTVRMRKLHLVRPELLPYPLAYEIYC